MATTAQAHKAHKTVVLDGVEYMIEPARRFPHTGIMVAKVDGVTVAYLIPIGKGWTSAPVPPKV
jgi:hypothetical protein